MEDIPAVTPGAWITVSDRPAVVCHVYAGGHLEVVYLDESNRAINDDVRWEGTRWAFVSKGPAGGYADNYPRLQRYVSILRAGGNEGRMGS